MKERVHLEFSAFLEASTGGLITQENIQQVRQFTLQSIPSLQLDSRVSMEERFISGPEGAPNIRLHIFKPSNQAKPLPAMLYIFGGGLITGNLEMNDAYCQEYALAFNCIVVAVEYRLAPEHPYPAGVEDCYAALLWLANNEKELQIDLNRLVVAGGSAGGNLTAAVSLMARDRKGPKISFQAPVCPMLDNTNSLPSVAEYENEFLWSGQQNKLAWEMYLGANFSQPAPAYASPLHADDFTGLPPTYTYVGELDVFRDETIEYVKKLTKARVPVEFHLYPGVYHGAELVPVSGGYRERIQQNYMDALNRALNPSSFT